MTTMWRSLVGRCRVGLRSVTVNCLHLDDSLSFLGSDLQELNLLCYFRPGFTNLDRMLNGCLSLERTRALRWKRRQGRRDLGDVAEHGDLQGTHGSVERWGKSMAMTAQLHGSASW
ncbi:hypothetical protein M0R45_032033 [Rubus argutus]|uniref:Uncharacterized protein n=1 Tax=Rubus argutus TaxID=59490 RepID=A0AAW1WJX6_RUBAR